MLGIDELLSLQWLYGGQIAVVPPLYETVTFNFRNGHTFVVFEDVEQEDLYEFGEDDL